MIWFVLAMAIKPEKPQKCQEELETVVGRFRNFACLPSETGGTFRTSAPPSGKSCAGELLRLLVSLLQINAQIKPVHHWAAYALTGLQLFDPGTRSSSSHSTVDISDILHPLRTIGIKDTSFRKARSVYPTCGMVSNFQAVWTRPTTVAVWCRYQS